MPSSKKIGASWRGGSTVTDSGFLIRPELTLDYSATCCFSDTISTRFQAGNLLNTPLRTYDYNNPAMVDRTDYYGRRFLFDMTYKY